jgi:ABC-2 type transport system permease protein
MKKYLITASTALRSQTNGGIAYMFPRIITKIIYLVPLMYIWRIITAKGVDAAMSLEQLLSYTYVNALLAPMLNVESFINDWDSAGSVVPLFSRPLSVYGQVIARTVGEWVPGLLMFSLPMALAAPLFGIHILPRTLWVVPSLFLCISLGFAMEFLFFCVTLRLKNVVWLMWVIRSAIVSFFSGTVIPFGILPFGMDRWMKYQPFGSLGGAVLSLYTGAARPLGIIPAQLFWNVLFWGFALFWFEKSKERMASYGG